MKCDDFEVMLAEALGGELSEADRPAFERHLAECAACRGDYETALATVSRLRSLPAADAEHAPAASVGDIGTLDHPKTLTPHPSPKRTGVVVPQVIPMPRRRWGVSALRYAASVALAFAAGYAANGMRRDRDAADPPPRPPIVGSVKDVQLADASFGAAFAETYQRQPSRSELSRCLAAMFGRQN